jgi:hypothetical protein
MLKMLLLAIGLLLSSSCSTTQPEEKLPDVEEAR